MPFFLLGLVAGVVGGFFVVKGTEAAGNLVKWTVAGGVIYLIAKKAKVF